MTTTEDILDGKGYVWVVEWCVSGTQRGLFHIQSLESTADSGLSRFFGASPDSDDWIVLGYFDRISKAQTFCNHLRMLQESGQAGGIHNEPKRVVGIASPGQVQHLRSMTYSSYLKSDHWQTVRHRMLAQARHACQLCGDTRRLNVHHRTYARRGCELYSDLIVLCRTCHEIFHERIGLVRNGGES